ncbi:MAG: DUF3667 domain-containing protein [Pseudomonadota bacterium]
MTSHSLHPAGHCANCSHPAPENFCPACGQKTHIETPTLFEFIHEYLHHYVALEGTLTRTLWTLLSRPGSLTAEYIAGRRQRYIKPLQLYLTISFIFFVLLGLIGAMVVTTSSDGKGEHQPAAAAKIKKKLEGKLNRPHVEDAQDGLELEKSEAAEAAIADQVKSEAPGAGDVHLTSRAPEKTVTSDIPVVNAWGERLEKRIANYNARPVETLEQLQNDAMHRLPYAIFGLMPIFAFLLWLIYFRRRMVYGVHLVFTLHVHAFTFLLLFLMLIPFVPDGLVLCAFLVYLVMALRKVYGGRWKPQIWRAALLLSVYSVVAGLAILALMVSLV